MTSPSGENTPNLSDLERRLQSVEDQLTIHRIIMTHPPAADTGDDAFWQVALGVTGRMDYGRMEYAQGSGRDVSGLGGIVTADQVALTTSGPELLEARRSGVAHVASAPIVVVAGDEAEAWNYHQTIVRADEGFRVFRVFVNHWEFARSAHGWQVTMRTVRLMDGDEEAIDILQGAVSASSALMGTAGGA